MRMKYAMLTYYQGNLMRQVWPKKTSLQATMTSTHSTDDRCLVNQHCPGCSASQPIADIESSRADRWVLVPTGYIRAVWWAYAALLMVIVLYWIVLKFYQSIFRIEYEPLRIIETLLSKSV